MKKITLILVLVGCIIASTGCYTNGWGCKGNSRIMTRVRQ